MYAVGELELEESKKLYGLTQCSRDLSSSDYKKCLDDSVSELPSCCDGKGGRVVGGSCNQGSKNRPSPVRLGRFITDSGLTESIPLPSTRRRVYRLKLGKTSGLGRVREMTRSTRCKTVRIQRIILTNNPKSNEI